MRPKLPVGCLHPSLGSRKTGDGHPAKMIPTVIRTYLYQITKTSTPKTSPNAMALISKQYLEWELVFFADIPSQVGSYCILDAITPAVPPQAVYTLRKTRTLASRAY